MFENIFNIYARQEEHLEKIDTKSVHWGRLTDCPYVFPKCEEISPLKNFGIKFEKLLSPILDDIYVPEEVFWKQSGQNWSRGGGRLTDCPKTLFSEKCL